MPLAHAQRAAKALRNTELSLNHTLSAIRDIVSQLLGTSAVAAVCRDPVNLQPVAIQCHAPPVLVSLAKRTNMMDLFCRRDAAADAPLSIAHLKTTPSEARSLSSFRLKDGPDGRWRPGLLLRLFGVTDEVRVLLSDRGEIWGDVSACRIGGVFSAEAVDELASLRTDFGHALRLCFERASLRTAAPLPAGAVRLAATGRGLGGRLPRQGVAG